MSGNEDFGENSVSDFVSREGPSPEGFSLNAKSPSRATKINLKNKKSRTKDKSPFAIFLRDLVLRARFFLWQIVPSLFIFFASFFVIILLAPERIFNSDEAVQAFRVFDFLRGNGLEYLPQFHGNALYFLAVPAVKIFGFSEIVFRSVPAIFCALAGTILAKISLPKSEQNFVNQALIALAFATTPLWIFYGNDFIQEALLVASAWLAGTLFFCCEKSWKNLIFSAIFGGFAIASKESWPFFVIAFLLAGIFSEGFATWREIRKSFKVFDLFFSKCFIFLIILLWIPVFFRSGFMFPEFPNLIDAGTNYFLILLPPLAFAIFAVFAKIFQKFRSRRFWFFAISSAILLGIYWLLPMREPWLVLSVVPGLILAVATAFTGTRKIIVLLALIFANFIAIFCGIFDKCGYAETNKSLTASLSSIVASEPLAIYGNAIWPIPFYLRERENVGYFSDDEFRSAFPQILAPVELWSLWDRRGNAENYRTRAVFELRAGIVLELRERDLQE